MQGIEPILSKASDLVWSWPLIVLLFGTHIRYGVARGLFSNESGLGSAP